MNTSTLILVATKKLYSWITFDLSPNEWYLNGLRTNADSFKRKKNYSTTWQRSNIDFLVVYYKIFIKKKLFTLYSSPNTKISSYFNFKQPRTTDLPEENE